MSEQSLMALERANEIRLSLARVKREIRSGKRSVCDVILDPPEHVERIKIGDLLLAAPRMGPLKLSRALYAVDVEPSTRLAMLTRYRRELIVTSLRQRYPTLRKAG